MIVYQLHVATCDDEAEGEDLDEFFGSSAAAKRRRAALAKEPQENLIGAQGRIDKITVVDLPKRELALALLNRTHWVAKREQVMPDFPPAGGGR